MTLKGTACLILSALLAGVAVAAPEEVTVLSWNTEHYNFERWPPETRKELERNMFALIRAANPDIFLIQETYGSFERFKAAFPEYEAVLQSACNSVFSKFPIRGSRRVWVDPLAKEPLPFNTPVLEVAEIDLGGSRLSVSSFAMFWLPLSVRLPENLSAEALLAWEAAPQGYPLTPRPKAIREALAALAPMLAEKDRAPLIVGGDFNSLSHLDWTAANAQAVGHRGRAVAWPVSKAMAGAGFVDAYRAVHPNAAAEPGLTCPMAGCDAKCPEPRHRIDFVYSAGRALKPVSCEAVHGPYHKPFAWRGTAFSAFPSDHAPLVARYRLVRDAERD